MKKQNSVRDTLAQRGAVHGDYTQDAACGVTTIDHWTNHGLVELDPVKRHALMMIAFKVARILHGDPNHKDHWHDIAGYATLAEDRCEKN